MRAESCEVCTTISEGVPTFRISDFWSRFEIQQKLDPNPGLYISARSIVTCKTCGSQQAVIRVLFYNDEEEFVLPVSSEPPDWNALVEKAEKCRWNGAEPKVLV